MAVPLLAIAIGANLAGSLLSTVGERQRLQELARKQHEAIQPLKDRFTTAQTGLSSSEGSLVQGATDRTLRGLASSGVIDSSISAGSVAGAVAPVQAQAADRRDRLAQSLASAQFQIAGNEALPGYAEAFGGSLGEIGGFLALMEGIKQGRGAVDGRQGKDLQDLKDLFGIEEDPDGIGDTGGLFSFSDMA